MGRLKTTEEYIIEATAIHGDRYDYRKVDYKNSHQKVTIICKEHGDFEITPDAHRSGQGCAECKYKRVGDANRGNLQDSIATANIKHNFKYDYSLITEYTHDRAVIEIICPLHPLAPFKKNWNNHKAGQGCPACVSNGFKQSRPGFFYILQSDNYLKVGITNRKVKDRIRSISKTSGKPFKEIFSVFSEDGSKVYQTERTVLTYLRQNYKSPTEVFDGSTECFIDVDADKLINTILPNIKE